MTTNKKLLASDYDWTFWRRDEKDLKDNLDSVNRWRENGNIFAISTGRDVASMLFEKSERNVDWDYMIALNGSFITDRENNILFKKSLDNDLARKLIKLMKDKFGDELIVSSGFEGCNYSNKAKSETCEKAKEVFERNSKIYSKTVEEALEDEVLLVGCLSDNLEKAQAFREEILAEYSDQVDVFINLLYINIVPKGISKASALDFIIKRTQINEDNVSVIGDDFNDIPMIKKFNGYSVPDAKDEVKEISSKIYDSVTALINDKI